MSLIERNFKSGKHSMRRAAIAIILSSSLLAGCTTGQVLNQGYVVDEQTLALAPAGSSREQVLLSLGSPSSTATFDAEVFYYISQKRRRTAAFMKPHLIEQSVLAVYFNKEGTVDRLANYTIKDGRVFDMLSRTTPTGGVELTFLQRLLKGGPSASSIADSVFGKAKTY